MRLTRAAVFAPVVLLLAACGFNSSPADTLEFRAPAGWRSSPGIMGFMQFWRSPSDDREVLLLFKSPKPLSPKDVFSSDQVNGTLKNTTVERRQAVTLCGHQPAVYAQARGTSSRGTDALVDMMMANIAGASYFAIYVRPVEASPNPMAEAALRELCAKP
jgi:hypothetical protein